MQLCVVVNEAKIVFGLLKEDELQGRPEDLVEDVMEAGPSTFRPHVPVDELTEWMEKHEVTYVPITTGEGKLVGVLFRNEAAEASS